MTISVEILIAIFFVLLTSFFTSIMLVKGIDYMQKNHPDYKGYDLFDEEGEEDKPLDEDEKDDIKD